MCLVCSYCNYTQIKLCNVQSCKQYFHFGLIMFSIDQLNAKTLENKTFPKVLM